MYLNFGSLGWWINSTKGVVSPLYLNAAYFAKLFQETPSLGYYTVVSLAQSQSLKLAIYFFEFGAIRGFTYRSFLNNWVLSQQLLPNFSSNFELIRRYVSDTLIEGYLHKAFSLKTLGASPSFGDAQKIGATGSTTAAVTWQYYALHLLQAAGVLAFLLFAVIYRSVHFV